MYVCVYIYRHTHHPPVLYSAFPKCPTLYLSSLQNTLFKTLRQNANLPLIYLRKFSKTVETGPAIKNPVDQKDVFWYFL